MVKRGWDAIGGSMGLVALIMGPGVCFADTLELEPHWRLDRIRSRLPKAFRASRRRARLSPASRQVCASGDYRAEPTLDAFRRMPGSGRVARKRRDQGECGVQRFHQLHDPNDANQSQVRRRDRLQSDRRHVARHDLCQMPPVAAGRHVFQQRCRRVKTQSPCTVAGPLWADCGPSMVAKQERDSSPRQTSILLLAVGWSSERPATAPYPPTSQRPPRFSGLAHPSGTPALRMPSITRSRWLKKTGLSLCAPTR